ncbi:hypothetical protein [Streptomyces sp. NPDC091299]|uniref:hypothetical protein n=1 Tax=Streptomyces sp. NPDC091299 TaxID=3155302 RepID=UPI003411FAD7
MPEIAIPDDVPSGPLREYLVWLQELHKDAGYPSSRTLAKILTVGGITCTHSTVTRLFKQYPSNRELVFRLITYLVENPLRRATRTEEEWDEFFDLAVRRLDRAKPQASAPAEKAEEDRRQGLLPKERAANDAARRALIQRPRSENVDATLGTGGNLATTTHAASSAATEGLAGLSAVESGGFDSRGLWVPATSSGGATIFPINRTLVEFGCGTHYDSYEDRAATYFAEMILAGPADWVMHTDGSSPRQQDMSDEATEDLFMHVREAHGEFHGEGAAGHGRDMISIVACLPKFRRGTFVFEVPPGTEPRSYLENFWKILAQKRLHDESEGYPEPKFHTACFVGSPDDSPFGELVDRSGKVGARPTSGDAGFHYFLSILRNIKLEPLRGDWFTDSMWWKPTDH